MSEEPFGPAGVINPVAFARSRRLKGRMRCRLAWPCLHPLGQERARLSESIEAGNLSINTLEASVAETPFGGVKESGFGREGGIEGLLPYTVLKTISHRAG